MEQIIKLTGRIAKVFPAQSGTSQRTGNRWMSQEYLLEYFTWSGATYPDRLVFRVFGEERIRQWNLTEMEENVTVYLRFLAHEHEGRWFNEVSATNIQKANSQQPDTNPIKTPETNDKTEATSSVQPTSEQADDLPF